MSGKPKRGRDLLVYIDRRRARGILSLKIKKNTERHQLKEYLCEAPYDTPVQRITYRITLSALLPLFGISDSPFVMTISDGEEEERFENCALIEKTVEITPDAYTKSIYVIESTIRKGGRLCGA